MIVGVNAGARDFLASAVDDPLYGVARPRAMVGSNPLVAVGLVRHRPLCVVLCLPSS